MRSDLVLPLSSTFLSGYFFGVGANAGSWLGVGFFWFLCGVWAFCAYKLLTWRAA